MDRKMNEEMFEDSSEEEVDSWISNFCSIFGHEYYVEVSQEFIEDEFNLTGLGSVVPFYRELLDMILDFEPDKPVNLSNLPLVEHSAELLYGLIHSRYILTRQGLQQMAIKYENKKFGVCSRYYCDGMHLIPISRYDQPGIETIRLYCPCCCDIYLPNSSRYLNIDGAFFGTTFAALFIKMYPDIEKQCAMRSSKLFDLKLFGFKLNKKSLAGPRMQWLRIKPTTEEEKKEFDECEFGIPTEDEDIGSESEYDDSEDERMQTGSNEDSLMSIVAQ